MEMHDFVLFGTILFSKIGPLKIELWWSSGACLSLAQWQDHSEKLKFNSHFINAKIMLISGVHVLTDFFIN